MASPRAGAGGVLLRAGDDPTTSIGGVSRLTRGQH
jgi:hypothetical protein